MKIITSLNTLYSKVAEEYLRINSSRVKEEVVKELLDSTYLKVVDDNKVYLTSFLEEDVVKITNVVTQLPLGLSDYIIFERYNDEKWSIFGCERLIDIKHQLINANDAVVDSRLDAAVIVVEKSKAKEIEYLKNKLCERVSVIEL